MWIQCRNPFFLATLNFPPKLRCKKTWCSNNMYCIISTDINFSSKFSSKFPLMSRHHCQHQFYLYALKNDIVMNCKKGCFVIIRHNNVRDITTNMWKCAKTSLLSQYCYHWRNVYKKKINKNIWRSALRYKTTRFFWWKVKFIMNF